MADARRKRTQARRREILTGLVIAMGSTLLLGMLPSLRVFWMLHLLLDVLFAGYVAALVHMKNIAMEHSAKVRYLPTRPVVEPVLALRRSVN
jgi:hypothetical protein